MLGNIIVSCEIFLEVKHSYITVIINVLCSHIWMMLGYYATSRKVTGSILKEIIGFLNLPNPCSHAMALGSTQPLTEVTAMYLRNEEKCGLTAICEPVVKKMWKSKQITTL
jgi:hypothetical protein